MLSYQRKNWSFIIHRRININNIIIKEVGMSYLIRQLKAFFYALAVTIQDMWSAALTLIPLPYLAILAYVLVALWQGWLAWRRHRGSSLARVEGWRTYIAKWALYRWWVYFGFFFLWLVQEATGHFFGHGERFKFDRLVSQVDLAFYNGQFASDNNEEDKTHLSKKAFYGSD